MPGGFILYEASGSGFDDGGSAFLPAGPAPRLGHGTWEEPQFVPLDGPWWPLTASWWADVRAEALC